MDMTQGLRAYVQVVDSGGFAAAAREMGVTRSSVAKTVAQLESELNAQLLARSTRKVSVTPTGEAFYERAREILAELDLAVNEVGQLQGELSGNLRVNAPMSFGTHFMGNIVAEFMQRHPDIHVELMLNDRFVDTIEEGYDVSIRIGEPEVQTSLVLEEIGTTDRLLCASPLFVEQHGVVAPDDLKQVRCLHYGYQQSGNLWQLEGPDGRKGYPVNCVFWSNNGDVLKQAALKHQGIALLPTFLIAGEIQSGQLVRVLPEYHLPVLSIQLLYPRHRYKNSRVQHFLEFVKEAVGSRPTWSLVD